MRPRFWFIPCRSGDYRLTDLDQEHSQLTVENPTPEDRLLLLPFLATMVEMGWLAKNKAKIQDKGLTLINLRVGIQIAGPLLVGQVHRNGDTWTAVRSVGGKISVNDGVDIETSLALPQVHEPVTIEQKEEKPQEIEAAATFTPPRRGCPPASACQRRASQVLRTFCSRTQWESWERHGYMPVIGNTTGIRYTLYHQDEAAARGFQHTLVAPRAADVSSARAAGGIPPREVCIWHSGLPPEEEALSIKMAVEHRERWLLSND